MGKPKGTISQNIGINVTLRDRPGTRTKLKEGPHMANETPSMVMYAAFKHFGMSNRDVANLLINTKLTFDGRMIQDRVSESSQLSRRIVRTKPGDLTIGMFNNFHLTCPRLTNKLIECVAIKYCGGDLAAASRELSRQLSGECAEKMAAALSFYGIDEFMYRNMVSYINHVDLIDENGRAVLHTMLFTITGCVGSPNTASLLTMDYATEFLGADYQTAPTVITNEPAGAQLPSGAGLGVVRMVDGRIKAGTRMHVLNPEGTEIGLFPQAKHTVCDVGEDASRRHAFAWRQEGCWYLKDLGSTNGTHVIDGSTGAEVELEPNGAPYEIHPTDTICLGKTTRFLIMPVLGS